MNRCSQHDLCCTDLAINTLTDFYFTKYSISTRAPLLSYRGFDNSTVPTKGSIYLPITGATILLLEVGVLMNTRLHHSERLSSNFTMSPLLMKELSPRIDY